MPRAEPIVKVALVEDCSMKLVDDSDPKKGIGEAVILPFPPSDNTISVGATSGGARRQPAMATQPGLQQRSDYYRATKANHSSQNTRSHLRRERIAIYTPTRAKNCHGRINCELNCVASFALYWTVYKGRTKADLLRIQIPIGSNEETSEWKHALVRPGHFDSRISILGIETYTIGISPSSEVKYGI